MLHCFLEDRNLHVHRCQVAVPWCKCWKPSSVEEYNLVDCNCMWLRERERAQDFRGAHRLAWHTLKLIVTCSSQVPHSLRTIWPYNTEDYTLNCHGSECMKCERYHFIVVLWSLLFKPESLSLVGDTGNMWSDASETFCTNWLRSGSPVQAWHLQFQREVTYKSNNMKLLAVNSPGCGSSKEPFNQT